jgi:hypothetical protein
VPGTSDSLVSAGSLARIRRGIGRSIGKRRRLPCVALLPQRGGAATEWAAPPGGNGGRLGTTALVPLHLLNWRKSNAALRLCLFKIAHFSSKGLGTHPPCPISQHVRSTLLVISPPPTPSPIMLHGSHSTISRLPPASRARIGRGFRSAFGRWLQDPTTLSRPHPPPAIPLSRIPRLPAPRPA